MNLKTLHGVKMPKRLQGWEKALSDFIEEMRLKPFKRGAHDCAMFAGRCAEVMTGEDFTSEFLGDYTTKKEAYEFLKKIGYDGLAAIAIEKLGAPLENKNFAGRGDAVLIEYDTEEALGIIDLTGKRAVTVGKDGLIYFDLKHCVKAWKI